MATTIATPSAMPVSVNSSRRLLDAQFLETMKDVRDTEGAPLELGRRTQRTVVQEQHTIPRRRIARVVRDEQDRRAQLLARRTQQRDDFLAGLARQGVRRLV